MNTLDKYRVTVCFFLEHNSSKSMRILVPCQDSWTINRLKDEAVRRLKKNLTPNNLEADGDENSQRLEEINVKHIENLSKDILDGDDIIRDVLDNKEILVARLEGDQDVDFFNDYHFRGARPGSIAGDSVHSTMLPGSLAYPESIHLPIRAETEIGTPERHTAFYHSYYPHERRPPSMSYRMSEDFMDMHPPPRPFAPEYYQGATDYEMPRIQPRYSFPRPDSCNSDIPHTSDSSVLMNNLHSRSPSVLSEEARLGGHASLPIPSHSHTFSNPEHGFPSSDTSPLVGVTSGDSCYSNNSLQPQLEPISHHPTQVCSPPISHTQESNVVKIHISEETIGNHSKPSAYHADYEDKSDPAESPPISPPPIPFGRNRPSVMHGYINPEPISSQAFSSIMEENSIIEEEPTPHQNVTKVQTKDSTIISSPKVTLRLISRNRSTPPSKPANPANELKESDQMTEDREDVKTPLTNTQVHIETGSDITREAPISDVAAEPQDSVVEPNTHSPLPQPLQPIMEPHIDKVVETSIEVPNQPTIETVVVEQEIEVPVEIETSPTLPQKRARTTGSPILTPITPLADVINTLSSQQAPPPKPDSPETQKLTPAVPQPDKPEEQLHDVSKPPMVGLSRGVGHGAIFVVELEKGMGGLGFGLKSRDTAADGMTYPHFVSSLKSGGVAQTDGRLRVGDLLLEVNGTDVTSLTHVKCLDFMRKQRGRVKLKVSRQDKSKQAGDPDAESFTEARIDDRKEDEDTMDLLTPNIREAPKEPVVTIQEESIEQNNITEREMADTTEQSLLSTADSNTSLDNIEESPAPLRETSDARESRANRLSGLNYMKQLALTDTTVYTPRGKKVEPLEIPLTDAGAKGLGVSVRGKTRMTTNGKAQEGGIFVKEIVPGGAADKDGRLKPNDQILSINGCILVGQRNQDAMETLKQGLNKISPDLPVIRLVVSKKSSVTTRTGKRAQKPPEYLYARKLSLTTKNSIPPFYANAQSSTLPSIYHPIRIENTPKNGEGKVFSVLDTHPELETSRDKFSASPPPDYESLIRGHIYEQMDMDKKRAKKGATSIPTDISRFRTAIQRSTDEEEHIYARPQRRSTEEGIYTRPNRVLYGRIGGKSQSVDNSLPRTTTYTEEIYAQPNMSKEEKSKRKSESIYEAPLMVKPKYREGVFKRRPREHLYESVNDAMSPESENDRDDLMDTSNCRLSRDQHQSVSITSPTDATRSFESNPSPTEYKNSLSREYPNLLTASKAISLQKTPSGGDSIQSLYVTGRSTPRGTRVVTSRAVPHAPISSTKRPRSRTGRSQYPNPIDLSPYFTSVQQQKMSSLDRMPIPLTEPPARLDASQTAIYKMSISEIPHGSTPLSTPNRPPPLVPATSTPFEEMPPGDVTFASEKDESLGPVDFKRNAQGRDDVSERHPFAKDAKQLTTYKEIQYRQAEEKLKAMQQQPDALSESSGQPLSFLPDSGIKSHVPLTGSASTPASDRHKDKLVAGKKGSFFGGLFKKKKGANKEKNNRDTPSPLLETHPPIDDLFTYTDMVPPDDD